MALSVRLCLCHQGSSQVPADEGVIFLCHVGTGLPDCMMSQLRQLWTVYLNWFSVEFLAQFSLKASRTWWHA